MAGLITRLLVTRNTELRVGSAPLEAKRSAIPLEVAENKATETSGHGPNYQSKTKHNTVEMVLGIHCGLPFLTVALE